MSSDAGASESEIEGVDVLDDLLGAYAAPDERAEALDNVDLGLRGGAPPSASQHVSPGAGDDARGHRPRRNRRRQPCEPMLLRPIDAEAAMFGETPPIRIEDTFDTSCDEADDDYDDDDEDDPMLGEVFAEPGNPAPQGGGGGGGASRRRPGAMRICFGCKFSSRPDLGDTDALIPGSEINAILTIWETQLGRVDVAQLAKMCHEYFKRMIFEPARKSGRRLPMWRTRDIYEHFIYHQMDPRTWALMQIKKWERVSRTLEETMFMQNMGQVAPAEKFMRLSLLVDKRVEELRRIKPGEMLFYNSDCQIDLDALGKRMNPVRDFA